MTMTTATIIGMMMMMMTMTTMKKKRKMQWYLKIIGRLDPVILGITETMGVSKTC